MSESMTMQTEHKRPHDNGHRHSEHHAPAHEKNARNHEHPKSNHSSAHDAASEELERNAEQKASEAGVEDFAELKERLLRALAETENVRRRAAREKDDAVKYASTRFARDIVTVADSLQRALESLKDEDRVNLHDSVKLLLEGVDMTLKQMLSIFEQHGIAKVDPLGEKFDHAYHQAMFEVETDDYPPGAVAQVLQPGYVLHDRLLRPALVGVAKAKSVPSEEKNETAGKSAVTEG